MPAYHCSCCGRPTTDDASSCANCGARPTPVPSTVSVPLAETPVVGWVLPQSKTFGRHDDPTRVGQIGAWLVLALGVVIVVAGLIVLTTARAALGAAFYFAFYLALAAPPLLAGSLALYGPSLATYAIAALVGGVYAAFLGLIALVARDEGLAGRLAAVPTAAAALASAALLTVSIVKGRDRHS